MCALLLVVAYFCFMGLLLYVTAVIYLLYSYLVYRSTILYRIKTKYSDEVYDGEVGYLLPPPCSWSTGVVVV